MQGREASGAEASGAEASGAEASEAVPPSVRQSSVRQSMASPEPEAATGLETPPARLSQHTEYDEEWNEVQPEAIL